MNKEEILKSIIFELKKEFATSVQSAMDAKGMATDTESVAENKYDTRGLEASYLAGAQAARAQQVRKSISDFEKIELKDYTNSDKIESTALVQVLIDGVEQKWFFILPQKGGIHVEVGEELVTTLSMESPLGQLLFHKQVGDSFTYELKKKIREYEITNIQ